MYAVIGGGTALRLFSGSDTEPAREQIEVVVSSTARYLGAIDNVVILPVLPSDPDAEATPGAWERHHFEPRASVSVSAPRKGADRIPVEVNAVRRTAKPVADVLRAKGVDVPSRWRAAYEHQLRGRRRRTEILVPLAVPAVEIVEFACRAIAALDPDRVTGLWLAVTSPQAGLPRSLTG